MSYLDVTEYRLWDSRGKDRNGFTGRAPYINSLARQKNFSSIFVTFSVFDVPYNSRGQIRDYDE